MFFFLQFCLKLLGYLWTKKVLVRKYKFRTILFFQCNAKIPKQKVVGNTHFMILRLLLVFFVHWIGVDTSYSNLFQQRSYSIHTYVSPYVCLSVRPSCLGGNVIFSVPNEDRGLIRASLLMDVVILVISCISGVLNAFYVYKFRPI